MDFKIKKCSFEDIRLVVEGYYKNKLIDSFMEDHILGSNHYKVVIEEKKEDKFIEKFVGYFSIFNKQLLSQYFIEEEYRNNSQEIFTRIIKYEELKEAFVSTSDEFYLSHVLDNHSKIEKQAYFFKDSKRKIAKENIDLSIKFSKAELSDVDHILSNSGDFFENMEVRINKGQIFIAEKDNQIIGYGIYEAGRISKKNASIGMFVLEEQRGKGYARNIILYMKTFVKANGYEAISGCWYYNHNSKKTLESAGMYSQTRLLKIFF